ncbi:MAG: hydantoinase B/oxoprolinase family protein [Halobacteria archaeon]
MTDSSKADGGIDPVTLEVVRNESVAAAEEMNAKLVRSSYSPNIKDRRDCSCALFDSRGEMASQAENIPVHLGAMPFSVEAAINEFEDDMNPGDSVLLNDPYMGGAHLPDLTLVTPVHHGEELVGYVANRAHHSDVGGVTAGSVSAEPTEIYMEGLRIPPVKFVEGGDLSGDVMSFVLANCRDARERRGDLRAQRNANQTGAERLMEIAEKHEEDIDDLFYAVQRYSEKRTRSEIEEIPDGTYTASDYLDGDGHGEDDVEIAVEVEIAGDEVRVDFSGSDSQVEGPVNAVFAVTASATYYCLRCMTDPDIPPNSGCYRPVEVVAPEGTVVNAREPSAVVGGNLEVSQRVVDVVLSALADAVPGKAVAAGQGTMNSITFGGVTDDGEFAFYETEAGGYGARRDIDGMDGVHVHMSNTLNTPAEVVETEYPLRVNRYGFRQNSGGAGKHRGGLGLRRDIEALEECKFSLLADRRRNPPPGVFGGENGARGIDVLNPVDGEAMEKKGVEKKDMEDEDVENEDVENQDVENQDMENQDMENQDMENEDVLDPKSTVDLKPGDVVSVNTPGGGGYGPPEDRDPEAVLRDLRLGKISREKARKIYGVENLESR